MSRKKTKLQGDFVKICPYCGSTNIKRINNKLVCLNCNYNSYILPEIRVDDIKYFRDHVVKNNSYTRPRFILINTIAFIFLVLGGISAFLLKYSFIPLGLPLLLLIISVLLFYITNLGKIESY